MILLWFLFINNSLMNSVTGFRWSQSPLDILDQGHDPSLHKRHGKWKGIAVCSATENINHNNNQINSLLVPTNNKQNVCCQINRKVLWRQSKLSPVQNITRLCFRLTKLLSGTLLFIQLVTGDSQLMNHAITLIN